MICTGMDWTLFSYKENLHCLKIRKTGLSLSANSNMWLRC